MKTSPTVARLRTEAEARLSSGQDAPRPLAPVDPVRLVHELQVHQIELELQNEELGRSYADMAALRDKYQDLYDFAPVGYFTVTQSGDIVELNLAAAALLGEDRAALVGRRLQDSILPESSSAYAQFIVDASSSEASASSLLALRRLGSSPVYVRVQGRPFASAPPGSTEVRIAMMDLTELKQANAELLLSFEKFFRYWRP